MEPGGGKEKGVLTQSGGGIDGAQRGVGVFDFGRLDQTLPGQALQPGQQVGKIPPQFLSVGAEGQPLTVQP